MKDNQESIFQRIQKYLEKPPLIILGSGASLEFGLPSMTELANEIVSKLEENKISSSKKFKSNLKKGLETAINQANFSDNDKTRIRKIVWEYIFCEDSKYFHKISIGSKNNLSNLLEYFTQTSNSSITILTTNYDRLIEYAADLADLNIITGFEGTYLKKFNGYIFDKNTKKGNNRSYIKLLKAHGSLDWFKQDTENFCIPNCRAIPKNSVPLIVLPENNKLKDTHEEPYRTIIRQIDTEIEHASGYLSIGYGFNDKHIHEKLIGELSKGKNIVVLAKKVTENCNKIIVNNTKISNKIILEEQNEKTKITIGNENCILNGNFWNLAGLLEILR